MAFSRVLLSITLSVLTAPAWATSFFCSPENQLQYKGINCCNPSISAEVCNQKIDQLSQSTIDRVAKVKQLIDQKVYPDGGYPNCHWNALYEQGVREAVEKWELLYTEVPGIIARDFVEISREELKAGDYVAVWFQTQVREFDEDTHKRVWFDVGTEVGHSAVYIGDNMVFQKESANSKEFSIQSIDEMFEAYDKGFNSQPQMRRGQGSLHFYRKK
ncbi:hypothetical protein [Bdellovibrio svalbardensis]|uniref:NlpC/P60 domain-containing protein n=1 Tax=Bdellovibrio svalbardensis TaxID=2972972 RepID=A0ABT6DEE6_9BACT|nr:hypothetical protein [Bdellovibrio svalbardensis]MDG0815158.1 hypothetical protein [Bdellovibrio svalbardensis]